MLPNPYVLLAVALAFAGACWKAYTFGYEKAEGDAALATEQALSAQKSELERYYAQKAKTEVIYRDRVKVITEESSDPSGCLDSDAPDSVLSAIRGN